MLVIRKFLTPLNYFPKYHSAIRSHTNSALKGLSYRTVISHVNHTQTSYGSYRSLMHSATNYRDQSSTIASDQTAKIGEYDTLTEYHAYDMIHKLSDKDRTSLSKALSRYDSEKIKSKFQGQLASSNWRLKFGRRTNEQLGSVDPTGSYCAMPDDWIKKKLAEAAVRPSNDELFKTFLVNGVPFVGFGFLDNFFMIIAGDYIESSLGVYMCITTMAAAALGNTISDVFGLGLAHYVEQFCIFIGIEAPNLTPTQQNMPITQRFGSMGRVVGITIGCIIGMFPLLLMGKDAKKGDEDEK